MPPQEITAHALALGITPELYPQLWECGCNYDLYCPPYECDKPRCTLPDPLSDDPRACLYEPFYMRALGWPTIHYSKGARLWFLGKPTWTNLSAEDFYALTEALRHSEGATPTAALCAAFLAKKGRDETANNDLGNTSDK